MIEKENSILQAQGTTETLTGHNGYFIYTAIMLFIIEKISEVCLSSSTYLIHIHTYLLYQVSFLDKQIKYTEYLI
jgi:hypothetical protein